MLPPNFSLLLFCGWHVASFQEWNSEVEHEWSGAHPSAITAHTLLLEKRFYLHGRHSRECLKTPLQLFEKLHLWSFNTTYDWQTTTSFLKKRLQRRCAASQLRRSFPWPWASWLQPHPELSGSEWSKLPENLHRCSAKLRPRVGRDTGSAWFMSHSHIIVAAHTSWAN